MIFLILVDFHVEGYQHPLETQGRSNFSFSTRDVTKDRMICLQFIECSFPYRSQYLY